MSDKEMGSFYAYINTIPDQMKITFHAIAKQLTVNNDNFEVACWSCIFPVRELLKTLCVILLGNLEEGRSFPS